MRSSPAFMAMKLMRSLAFHSHSRFCSTAIGPSVPNMLLLSVVSIWKTLTPESFSTLPMRQFDECSSLAWRSMNDLLCCMVWTLWWWRRLL